MTVARLGIDIDSAPAVQSARDLEKLVPAAQKAERAVDSMAESIGRGAQRSAQELERVTPSAQRTEKALDSMGVSAGRVGRNVAQELERIAPSAQRAERAVDSLASEATQSATAVNAMGTGFQRLNSGQIQNVAFQVGDFATQVGAGQSASVALAQQLPQLLGGFGALGAVLGAVAAIGIPLGAAFLRMSGDATDYRDAIEDARSSTQDLVDLIRNRKSNIDDLAKSFGGAEQAARRLVDVQIKLALAESRSELDAVVASLSEFAAESEQARVRYEAFSRGAWQDPAVDRLIDLLKIAEADAQALAERFRDLSETKGPEEQAAAFAAIMDFLTPILGDMSSLNEEGREFVRSLSRGDEIGRQVVQAIADADANAAALRDQTEGAVASAGALEAAWRSVGDAVNTVARGEVRAALAAASYEHRGDPIAQAEARARIEWGAEYGDPTQAPAELRGAMEDLREQHVAYARAAAESQEALRLWNEEQRKAAAEGRKAGRSGESEIVREAKRLERENEARQEYISSLVFEASMVGATSLEQAKANALRRLGAEATAEQRAQAEGWIEAIHREREALRANEEAMQHLKDVSRDVLQGITQDLIDGASAADILSNALLRVAQSMVQTGIDSLIEVGIGAFGNAIGGGGGRLPAPTAQNLSWVYHDGGIVGQDGRPRMVDSSVFAGAPRYHSGVAGLAPDEVPAILQRGERIIPRGGSDQKLEVHIHENAADGQHQVQHSPGRLDIRLAKQALGDMVRGGGLDSAMTQRFGVRPKAMGG